jgi:L-lactate dehydrogenase complex protein LldG
MTGPGSGAVGASASHGAGSAATARAEVLARIRAANQAAGSAPPPEIPRDYRRTGEHPPGADELVELLRDRLVDYRATVVHSDPDGVPAAVAGALADVTGPVVLPPGLPPGWCPEGVVDGGVIDGAGAGAPAGRPGAASAGFTAAELDRFAAVVTGCAAACAETGTIALDGSPDQGRRAITLVPDLHVCVVRADQVVHTVPELLAALTPDRPITFISGPSATSDIELQRVEGVHGPRTLIVVLVR